MNKYPMLDVGEENTKRAKWVAKLRHAQHVFKNRESLQDAYDAGYEDALCDTLVMIREMQPDWVFSKVMYPNDRILPLSKHMIDKCEHYRYKLAGTTK